MTRSWRINNDQIPSAFVGELFHLPEYHQVVNSRGGRPDHLDHPGGCQSFREAPETLVEQIVLEGRTGRDHPNRDLTSPSHLVQRRPTVKSDKQHTESIGRSGVGDRSAGRGATNATLAEHKQHPATTVGTR
jgi:hypothetical protein